MSEYISAPPPSRCGILIPFTASKHERSLESRREEAEGLARAIDLDIAFIESQTLREARSATLFGKGKVDEIAERIAEEHIGLMIVDGVLGPIQQRNLEKAWKCKVIDRTALILEIFGARARTREGVLQVELASLNYQKSRIVRSWTHLERQRGGFGFLGGPGETQKEADRRMIDERIAKIKKQLENVTKTRRLHRESRKAVPYPVIALVGYTNAGKSTLFNTLTNSDVLAEDKLFATLDPTMRALRLPSGLHAILSDTVGFVSNLPHELVAAFRATLEEVIEADLILHIRDIASPETEMQSADVHSILAQLLDEKTIAERVVEVANKVDILENLSHGERSKDAAQLLGEGNTPSPASLRSATSPSGRGDYFLGISALTGFGIPILLRLADEKLQTLWGYQRRQLTLPASDGKRIAWLHAHATVHAQTENEGNLHLDFSLRNEDWERFGRV